MTQTAEARRLQLTRAIDDLKGAGQLAWIPELMADAAIRIGRFGWWNGRSALVRDEKSPCCIWLAVGAAVDTWSYRHPGLKEQALLVIMAEINLHFGIKTIRELFDLNDKQPDHEGQAWAIYHLGLMVREFKVRHGL